MYTSSSNRSPYRIQCNSSSNRSPYRIQCNSSSNRSPYRIQCNSSSNRSPYRIQCNSSSNGSPYRIQYIYSFSTATDCTAPTSDEDNNVSSYHVMNCSSHDLSTDRSNTRSNCWGSCGDCSCHNNINISISKTKTGKIQPFRLTQHHLLYFNLKNSVVFLIINLKFIKVKFQIKCYLVCISNDNKHVY